MQTGGWAAVSAEDTLDEVPPSIPPLHGRWQIGDRLGGGGEGIVYAVEPIADANDPGGLNAMPGARVAAKFTWSRTGESELRALLKLQHRHLATYRDFGFLSPDLWRDVGLRRPSEPGEELMWILMSRASGSLADQIDERAGKAARPIDAASAVRLWHQLADALAYLEEQQVVHGDIKPANVLAYETSQGTDWRLADFGMSAEVSTGLARVPVGGGTRTYSSPEVLRTGQASTADDRYSAALTVHVAATGVLPFGRGGRVRLRRSLPRELRKPVFDAVAARTPGAPTFSHRRRKRGLIALGAGCVGAVIAAIALAPGLRSEGGQQAATTTTASRPVVSSTTTEAPAPVVTTEPPVTEVGPIAGSQSSLYFIQDRAGTAAVYRLDLATNETRRVQTGSVPLNDLSVSASGRFVGTTTTDDGDLLVVGDLGSDRSRLYDVPGDASEPTISPDGSLVAFVSDATGDLDVMVLELSTERAVTVAGNAWDERLPTWDESEVTGGAETRLVYVSSRRTDAGEAVADEINHLNLGSSVSLDDLPAADSIDLASLPGMEGEGARVTSLAVPPSAVSTSPDYLVVLETSSGNDLAVLSRFSEDGGEVELTAQDEVEVTWCPEGAVVALSDGGLLLVPANENEPQLLSQRVVARSLSCIGVESSVVEVDEGSGTVSTDPSVTTTTRATSDGAGSNDDFPATTVPPTTTTTTTSRTTVVPPATAPPATTTTTR